jgi:hypothetical protein
MATISKHCQNFKAQEKVPRVQGRPAVLTTEDVEEIINVILNAQITRRPVSGPNREESSRRNTRRLYFWIPSIRSSGQVDPSASAPQYRWKLPGYRSLDK